MNFIVWHLLAICTVMAVAFVIGYSGIRLLPKLEQQMFKRIDKIGGSTEKEKD